MDKSIILVGGFHRNCYTGEIVKSGTQFTLQSYGAFSCAVIFNQELVTIGVSLTGVLISNPMERLTGMTHKATTLGCCQTLEHQELPTPVPLFPPHLGKRACWLWEVMTATSNQQQNYSAP